MPFKKVFTPGKTKPGGAAHWSEKKKLEVLQAYIVIGQLRLAAATCNVPECTAKSWKQSQWWKDTEYELRRSSKIQLSTKLNEVVGKAVDQLQDRVVNGDFVYNPKTKEYIRKPISAEHANRIVANQIDRMQALDKSVNAEKIDADDISTRLEKLKNDLIKGFSRPSLAAKPKNQEVKDFEDSVPVGASPDERVGSSDLALHPGLSESPASAYQIALEQGPKPA